MLKQMKLGEGLSQQQREELEKFALGGIKIEAKRGKRLYRDNMAENSEEFKQLGTLHRENRHLNYPP